MESDVTQLRDKVKRLSRSRGPESVMRFEEERPTKLKSEEGEKKKTEPVEEQEVVAVDVTAEEEGSR